MQITWLVKQKYTVSYADSYRRCNHYISVDSINSAFFANFSDFLGKMSHTTSYFNEMDAEQYIKQILEEPDDFESADIYLQRRNARKPPEIIEHLTSYDDIIDVKPSNTLQPGDITALLQNVPGILGYAGEMQRSVKPCSVDDQPDMITTERIPIYLSSKYFQGLPNNASSDANKSNGRNKTGGGAKSRRKASRDELHPTIYASDTKKPVKESGATKQKSAKPELYNAFEIYQLKRVSSHAWLYRV